MNSYQDDIARAWDNINESLVNKTKAISLAGIKTVPNEWFPDLKGKDILALASGGGLFDKYMNSYVAVRAIRK